MVKKNQKIKVLDAISDYLEDKINKQHLYIYIYMKSS